MGWSVGFDSNWNRDIGYGVPAICDHPDCSERIDRGLAYVCCDEHIFGGEEGCGLFFCGKHRSFGDGGILACERCLNDLEPFTPKPDLPEWIDWKLTHESWQSWRQENPEEVARLRAQQKGEPE